MIGYLRRVILTVRSVYNASYQLCYLINTQHCVCVATEPDSGQPATFNEVQFSEIVRVLEPIHSVNYNDWEIFVNK